MASRSKLKGSAYEAKIAEIFTKEFNREFRRVPLSGSIDYLKGDIWVPSDTAYWPYAIECKHYADLAWNNLLTAKTTDILNFWKQTVREAEQMNKKPLLCFRWNRSKDFVAYDDDIVVPNFIHITSFGYSFKISLLDEWIAAVKSQTNLASS